MRPPMHVRAESTQWLMEHDGTHPGDFIDYHVCPEARRTGVSDGRIEVIRPASGDWTCYVCGVVWPMLQSAAKIVAEGSDL